MGLLDRDIRRTTTTAPRTSTRAPRRQATVSPINNRAIDYFLRHPDAKATFTPAPTPRPATAPPRVTTSGSGGGGGGGSTFDPVQAQVAVDEAEETRLATLRAERLEAALAAISAQFDFQEGSLQGQQRDLVSLFEQLMAGNQRNTRNTTRSVQGDATNRGLGRSGIFARNLAEALAPLAEERADVIGRLNPEEGAEGTEIRQIMSALLLLEQQRSSASASAEVDSRTDELDLEEYLALLSAGLSTG